MADDDAVVPPQQVPLVYANIMSASASPVDLSLDFGYRGSDGVINMAVRVAMSWEHAQLVHQLMGQLLDRYQEDVGEIRDVSKNVEIRPIEATRPKGEEQ